MKIFASALTAVGLLAAPAFAGGMTDAPAPMMAEPLAFAPQYDWTGFSIGAQLGYGEGDVDVSNALGTNTFEGDGELYGLRAYYDYDFGRFILGAGVQYDKVNIDADNSDLDSRVDGDSIFRAGLRAGIDSGRNWYYATAGYARVDAELDLAGARSDIDSDGYFVGLGYEVFLTENVTAGAEVLYHEFDDFDIDGADAELDATTAALSVNFRF